MSRRFQALAQIVPGLEMTRAHGLQRLDMSAWWSASVCSRVMPPNKAPEATRVGRFFLFIKGFWLLGIAASRGCLSFFR